MALTQTIYNVDPWEASRAYVKNEPAYISGDHYRYASITHTSDSSFDGSKWYGVDINGSSILGEFIWNPSYPVEFPLEPKSKIIQFGDGYSQRSAGQINNNLLVIDMTFEGRDTAEATAILHFLDQKKGVEAFYFTPPQPFATKSKFICKTWNPTVQFYNTYNIKVRFEEVAA